MMELTCAFILISASLVSATPYGYGVKGGASARAESSASAGAFGAVAGEIPVAVPLGTGYSGSFSKSSSSSSSSSSASSSSSSSSFSYSNSGAGGFGLNGGGCSSGNCQTVGGDLIPAPHGSSAQGYNSANVATAAGAGAVSVPGCQGQSCYNHSEKCASGQCKPKSQTGTTPIDSDSNLTINGASPTEYSPNDIHVVTDKSDFAHNAKDQSSTIDKTSSAYNGADSHCSQGKCGPLGPLSSKPNYNGYDSGNSYQGTSATNKQQVTSLDTGIASHYQKPSTHLETPKLGSKCNSGNCNAESAEPGHETSPSSYNVPIHGEYNRGEQKPSCDGVKCENQPKETYSYSTNSVSLSTIYSNPQHSLPTENSVTPPGPSSFINPSSTNCGGSSCFGIPANQFTGSPNPGDLNFGHKPSNAPTSSVTNCKYPNCSPYATNPAPGLNVAPGHTGHGKPSDVNKPPNDKLPAYTGGFGGPSGVLNPNEFDIAAPIGIPSHGPASTSQNGNPLGIVPTSCNLPSCSGYPSVSGPNVPTGTYNNNPGGEISSEKLPTYTGGFGGPTGMLKPNEFDDHAIPQNPNRPTIGLATACLLGNCGITSGTTASSGYFGTTKPGIGVSSPSENLPTYNGGPEEVFNPNKLDAAAPTGNPNHAHASTSQNRKPLGSVPTSCNSPSCSGYPSASGPSVPTGTYNHKPGGEVPSGKFPTYTGGFGGPTGMLKPNEFDDHAIPQNPNRPTIGLATTCLLGNCGTTSGTTATSGYFGTAKPSTGISSPSGPGGVLNPDKYDVHATGPSSPGHTSSDHPGGCNTPNCYPSFSSTAAANSQAVSFGVSKPSLGPHLSSVTLPAYPTGYDKPSVAHRPNEISAPGLTPSFTHTQSPYSPGSYSTGCKTGNCAIYPTGGPSADANAQPGSFGITKPNADVNPAGSTLPQNTGFNGPSGILKPNEHTYITPSTGSALTNCRTPNCVNAPTGAAISGANAQSGSFGITKPSGDNNLATEKPVYAGGFGGPSGLLKPNEYTAPAVRPTPDNYNRPTGVSTPDACTSGNCNNHVPSSPSHSQHDASNGAHATAAATAEANAVAYSGGFGGPPGVLEPYDDGKIGVSSSNGGQAHGSQSGSAHYSSHNANIHSPHVTIPGANSGPTEPAGFGAHGNTGAQAGSTAGSTANAGAATGAFAGAHGGYSTHGSNYNQAGNIKGGSLCGGGCGGSSRGAYNGAAAKSLAGANAFGVGGSYASSSASAQASAGAYTKGGYGKR